MKYAKNTKKKILLHVPQTGMTIPATLICGRETGKTITVSAGVHSREYIGIEALIRLAQELTPENVQGTILLLHCCNYDGFLSRSADVVPHDGKNLDREFPGTVDGHRGLLRFWKRRSSEIRIVWWIYIPAVFVRT